MVGGWFRGAKDYYYPVEGMRTSPPPGLRKPGESWQEHWWVEVLGWFVDVSADQFFPTDPEKQKEHEIIITPANFDRYYPYRRRPLNRNVRLPPSFERLANKILSLKRAAGWDRYRAMTWFQKYGPKYGLTEEQIVNLGATLKHERVAVDFTDADQVRSLLSEVI